MIIDLEALVRPEKKSNYETAEEEIHLWIGESVLGTGVLPYFVWDGEGEGIDGSAIHGRKGQKLPFKVPTVAKSGDF